ncbi:contact-dependent growth inhibition system immunity protein [Serratia marcescens]|uniref:contact-dependent growth inhibition system immunity protein n=1 Tax=Serratia marcescens TaxID=615 RepID=UPI0012B61D0F|nr:contact-dependent growth inhibition system immunity protein [Serratia marcescens]MDP8727276.1 contact-dependent growth inhibition system immunity protein [Serratia marcescens]
MKTSELDNLIAVYFGQDYDLINADGDITALLAEYIRLATHQQREALIEEIVRYWCRIMWSPYSTNVSALPSARSYGEPPFPRFCSR